MERSGGCVSSKDGQMEKSMALFCGQNPNVEIYHFCNSNLLNDVFEDSAKGG